VVSTAYATGLCIRSDDSDYRALGATEAAIDHAGDERTAAVAGSSRHLKSATVETHGLTKDADL